MKTLLRIFSSDIENLSDVSFIQPFQLESGGVSAHCYFMAKENSALIFRHANNSKRRNYI